MAQFYGAQKVSKPFTKASMQRPWGDIALPDLQKRGGSDSYPFGKDAGGYLMYHGDGYMFVAIMRPTRAKFAAGDVLRGSIKEKGQAADAYVFCGGRYEFQTDTIIYHVEVGLFPDWVGVEQERLVELRGNRLTLGTGPMLLESRQQSDHLNWENI